MLKVGDTVSIHACSRFDGHTGTIIARSDYFMNPANHPKDMYWYTVRVTTLSNSQETVGEDIFTAKELARN